MEFETEEVLMQIIFEELRSQEHSISSLWRVLSKERKMKIHRLELTGYLKAMADFGLLKEKPRPPSKYYSITAHGSMNIYEMVGQQCDKLDLPEKEKGSVALFLLHRIFKRPILLEEMRMAGYSNGTFDGVKVAKNMSADSMKLAKKMGLSPPRNDPAFEPARDFEGFFSVYVDILISNLNLQKGVKGTHQVTLTKF